MWRKALAEGMICAEISQCYGALYIRGMNRDRSGWLSWGGEQGKAGDSAVVVWARPCKALSPTAGPLF